jgi:uncharacterized protein YndB with AHSA1/START domain
MTIELTRTIAASPDTVFRALTDAGELSRWWTTTAESDARTGGAFSYGFEFADPSRDHTYTGSITRSRPASASATPGRPESARRESTSRCAPAATGRS